MGLVIRFPDVWRNGHITAPPSEEATVIILPVVRIERDESEKSAMPRARAATRRRKRPASRS